MNIPSLPLTLSITDFGAKGDGETLNTKAVQDAIDACEKSGVVLVEGGEFVVGTLFLKSDIELRVADGAELLGSTSLDDYSRENQGAVEAPAFDECLLYAENAKNITITGGGAIDGRGHPEHFPVNLENGKLGDRPMLIRFVKCQGVTFENITLKNAASWCTHLVECDDVIARNMKINSRVNVNNDGFDLDNCHNVLIEDCDIVTGDDSICPKSTTERPCESIVVRNCKISSHTAALKLGTSSRGGFKAIKVTDSEFYDCKMGAIKLQLVDGGSMEDILVENIVMKKVEGPIFIRLGSRGRTFSAPIEQVYDAEVAQEGAPTGTIKEIVLRNIKAEVWSDDRKQWGIMITGVPGHFVEDVRLENVEVIFPGGGTPEEAENVVGEDEARYPEQYFFGTLPSWGAFIRHAKNIEFKNVTLTVREPDARNKFMLEDVHGFTEI